MVKFVGLVPDFRMWLLQTISLYDNLVSSWMTFLRGRGKIVKLYKELGKLAKADPK